MRILARGLLLALTAAFGMSAPAVPAPAPRLERVVLVMRHGVRPPTAANAELDKLSAQPWPAWPVAPGELTPHGAEVVRIVAAGVRAAYARDGLLPVGRCPAPGAVAIWADGHDQRTRASGEAFAQAVVAGCGLASRSGPAGEPDPLFGGVMSAACVIDPAAVEADVRRVAGPSGLTDADARGALDRLQAIVAPRGCAGGQGVCLSGPDALSAGAKGAKLSGPLPGGASLAEDLFLEYAEGKPAAEVGWGRADGAAIAAVMPAHERYAALTRSAPYLAGRRGGLLAGFVLRALEGRPAPGDPPVGTRLTVIAGHDTNLSTLQGVFGLSWKLPGQPDSTAPATALAFELWREPDGRERVRTRVFYLPLEAMRGLDRKAAAEAPVTSSCGPKGCELTALRAAYEARTPEGCRTAGR